MCVYNWSQTTQQQKKVNKNKKRVKSATEMPTGHENN